MKRPSLIVAVAVFSPAQAAPLPMRERKRRITGDWRATRFANHDQALCRGDGANVVVPSLDQAVGQLTIQENG